MKEHILEIIKQIELDYPVKVLFACESGSRAWGFPSMGSDYDVRFLYVHRVEWYLSIDQKRDVIEIPRNDKISIPINQLLDTSGWELRKALKLLRKSNPPLLEWLFSDIQYYEKYSTASKMRSLAHKIFSINSCILHYLNMAKGNYQTYLTRPNTNIKKYFYVLRPLLAAKWIEKYQTMPPIKFQDLLNDLIPERELMSQVEELMSRKMAGEELMEGPKVERILAFLETEINRLEMTVKNFTTPFEDPTEELNLIFRETLSKVWHV
jgi:uncharacterized protein